MERDLDGGSVEADGVPEHDVAAEDAQQRLGGGPQVLGPVDQPLGLVAQLEDVALWTHGTLLRYRNTSDSQEKGQAKPQRGTAIQSSVRRSGDLSTLPPALRGNGPSSTRTNCGTLKSASCSRA